MNIVRTVLWWISVYLVLMNLVPIILFKGKISLWIGLFLGSSAFVFYVVQTMGIRPGVFKISHAFFALMISGALYLILDRGVDRFMHKLLPDKGWFDEAMKFLFKNYRQGFVWAVLIGPVTEEILFRYIIQRELYQVHVIAAVVITTVLFAALHLNLYQFVSGMISGLVLGMAYLMTGSLWFVIMIHVFYNGMSYSGEYRKQKIRNVEQSAIE